jgi:hypothetical protein
MQRIRIQKTRRRTDSRVASLGTQPPPMDCRDLDVVRAKQLQREGKC